MATEQKYLEFLTLDGKRVLVLTSSIVCVDEVGDDGGTILYVAGGGTNGIALSESYVDVVSKIVL